MSNSPAPTRDLTTGISARSIVEGATVLGHVGDEAVVLARAGDRLFAVGAHCTHYRGPLAEGLIVGETVRCPWHHACFSLETGAAVRAPALDPIDCWRVDQEGDRVFVREKLSVPGRKPGDATDGRTHPSSIMIVGGGAAGLCAVNTLRSEGYHGPVTIVSADADPPVDRPNLSKDFLAGEAQDDWLPLWPPERYQQQDVELVLGSKVASIDPGAHQIVLENGSRREFGALLLATGSEPVRLAVPGAETAHVHYLRTWADSRAIVERTKTAQHAVVVGSSFIGLEVAASLRARNVGVDVVTRDRLPLERVMGPELGRFVQSVHESHGVVFHLERTLASIDGRKITLNDGTVLDADFVVMGVGVTPITALGERAGLALDRGILVNELLETSAPGIFAAGDAARWPDPHTGDRIRVEHWVVAGRQGQVAARNMLGRRQRFDAVPFFWSQHYDMTIRYIGHAERWDRVQIDGSLEARDASVTFLRDGRKLACATVSRDRENLQVEVELEGAMPAVVRASDRSSRESRTT